MNEWWVVNATQLPFSVSGNQIFVRQGRFICIAHFTYKTIQSDLHETSKALQQGAEEAWKGMLQQT